MRKSKRVSRQRFIPSQCRMLEKSSILRTSYIMKPQSMRMLISKSSAKYISSSAARPSMHQIQQPTLPSNHHKPQISQSAQNNTQTAHQYSQPTAPSHEPQTHPSLQNNTPTSPINRFRSKCLCPSARCLLPKSANTPAASTSTTECCVKPSNIKSPVSPVFSRPYVYPSPFIPAIQHDISRPHI